MRRPAKKSKVLLAVLLPLAVGGVLVGASPPAFAASNYATCTAPIFHLHARGCDTAPVRANARGHYLDVTAYACGPNIPWRIWDVSNGVVVKQGVTHSDRRGDHVRITGLYGTYVARIWNTCAHDQLVVDAR